MIRFLQDNVTAATNGTEKVSDVEGGGSSIRWDSLLAIIALLIASAYCNGVNIGVLGIDESYLELLTKGPFESKKEENEAKLASVLIPLRKKGNQLLVTVLLGCSITNTSISILMAEAEGDLSGFLISTVLTMLFGEIFPQALCNRFGLQIGAYSRLILYFFYYALYIVTYPIAAVIDKVLGDDEGNFLSKSRMKKLFEQFEKEKTLNPSERKMLSAALELKTKTVGEVMTPLEKAFMLDIN